MSQAPWKGPVVSFACYQPLPGRRAALLKEVRGHHRVLSKAGLVTKRARITVQARNGTVIEVFEWKSAAAIEKAHSTPSVLKMWERFGKACTYVPLATLKEVKDMFAGFEPLKFR